MSQPEARKSPQKLSYGLVRRFSRRGALRLSRQLVVRKKFRVGTRECEEQVPLFLQGASEVRTWELTECRGCMGTTNPKLT